MLLSDLEKQILEDNLRKNYDELYAFLSETQKADWLVQKERIISFCVHYGIYLTAGVEKEIPYDDELHQLYMVSTFDNPFGARNFRFHVSQREGQSVFLYRTTGIAGIGRMLACQQLSQLVSIFSSSESPPPGLLQQWLIRFDQLKGQETRLRDNFFGFESVLTTRTLKDDFFNKREAILEFCLNNQIDDLVIRINEIPGMAQFLLTGLLHFFRKNQNDKGYSLVNTEQAKAWVDSLKEQITVIEGDLRQLTEAADVDVAHQFMRTQYIDNETLLTVKDLNNLLSRSPPRVNGLSYKPFAIEMADDYTIRELKRLIQNADSKELFLPVNFQGHWFYFLRNPQGAWSIQDSQAITKLGLIEASKAFLATLGIPSEEVVYESTKRQQEPDNFSCGTHLINAYRNTKQSHQTILTECLLSELSEAERNELPLIPSIFRDKKRGPRRPSLTPNPQFFDSTVLEYKVPCPDLDLVPLSRDSSAPQLSLLNQDNPKPAPPKISPKSKPKMLEMNGLLKIYLPLLEDFCNEPKLSHRDKKLLKAFTLEGRKIQNQLTLKEDYLLGQIAVKIDTLAQLVMADNVSTIQAGEISGLKNEIKNLCTKLPSRSKTQVMTVIIYAIVGVVAIGAIALSLGFAAAAFAAIGIGGFGVVGSGSLYFFGKPKTKKLETLSLDLTDSMEETCGL